MKPTRFKCKTTHWLKSKLRYTSIKKTLVEDIMLKRMKSQFNKYIGFIPSPKVAAYFIGKIVDLEQTPFPQNYLEKYIKKGFFKIRSGIKKTDNFTSERFPLLNYLNGQTFPRPATLLSPKYVCQRCQTTTPQEFIEFNCAKCNQICVYCRHCINMGRIATCTKLITWEMPIRSTKSFLQTGPIIIPFNQHKLTWVGQLTELQQKASDELNASIQRKTKHIVHAVCGAGKTELLFQPIYNALCRGERVCVATPRTDVVLELLPRFQQALQNTKIQALYGGAEQIQHYCSFILATTHQLYRFEQAFDVVIVDEADAFPYTYDLALQKAVEKAKKKVAATALVTATPSAKILQTIEHGEANYSFIPKRFHNYPLPVPRNESLWFYNRQLEKGKIPKKLEKWIGEQIAQQRPFLLFFPTIQLMEKSKPLLQQLWPTIESVHADDPNRKEKVMLLREEKVPGLMTTTILERGITIKNVQVAVIGAENKIFDANALIQIAGRVGRNKNFPNGDIVFFHHGITTEMDYAINQIKKYNTKAGF